MAEETDQFILDALVFSICPGASAQWNINDDENMLKLALDIMDKKGLTPQVDLDYADQTEFVRSIKDKCNDILVLSLESIENFLFK